MSENRQAWMRRLRGVAILIGCLIAGIAAFVTFVNSGAPDGAMTATSEQLDLVIRIGDGETLTVREAIEALAAPDVVAPTAEGESMWTPWTPDSKRAPTTFDLYILAMQQFNEGETETAEALLLSIPRGDPEYSRAQRQLGRWVFLSARKDPQGAVPHVRRALLADPVDPSAWEDAARVYLSAAGLD